MFAALSAAILLATTPVSLKAADGRAVSATWSAAPGASADAKAPAALLVAESGQRAGFTAIAKKLGEGGLSTLTIQARALAADQRFDAAAPDVAAAAEWLKARKDVDVHHLLVIGAGDASLVALAAASADLQIAGLAMLSPRIDPDRLDDKDAMELWGDRPVFVAVARGDRKQAMSGLVLDGQAKGARKIHISEGTRRGTALVDGDRAAMTALVEWTRVAAGLAPAPPDPRVEAERERR